MNQQKKIREKAQSNFILWPFEVWENSEISEKLTKSIKKWVFLSILVRFQKFHMKNVIIHTIMK